VAAHGVLLKAYPEIKTNGETVAIVTLLHEMQKTKTQYGLATICIAGGLGLAAIYENLT
jgi:hypothetical protein